MNLLMLMYPGLATLLPLTLERKQALRISRNVRLRLQLLMEVDHFTQSQAKRLATSSISES